MGKTGKETRLKSCLVGMLLAVFAVQVSAFEGDYIWEERFKRQWAKAQAGQAKDQYLVANMYLRGTGTEKDVDQALYWYLQAAKQGHTRAAYKAGYLYLHKADQLSSASPEQALPWIQKAAQAGYSQAQYDLGQMYSSGQGVEQDGAQALKWLGRAKKAGYTPAQTAFDRTVKHVLAGTTISSDKKQQKSSVELVQAAVDQSDTKGIILRSQWRSQDGPSTFLPSKLTNCRENRRGIECLSSELNMQLSSARVVYRTRAVISDINADGEFKLAYEHDVLSTENQTASSAPLKTGLQSNEHVLDCSLLAGRTISCGQGTQKQYRFTGGKY